MWSEKKNLYRTQRWRSSALNSCPGWSNTRRRRLWHSRDNRVHGKTRQWRWCEYRVWPQKSLEEGYGKDNEMHPSDRILRCFRAFWHLEAVPRMHRVASVSQVQRLSVRQSRENQYALVNEQARFLTAGNDGHDWLRYESTLMASGVTGVKLLSRVQRTCQSWCAIRICEKMDNEPHIWQYLPWLMYSRHFR